MVRSCSFSWGFAWYLLTGPTSLVHVILVLLNAPPTCPPNPQVQHHDPLVSPLHSCRRLLHHSQAMTTWQLPPHLLALSHVQLCHPIDPDYQHFPAAPSSLLLLLAIRWWIWQHRWWSLSCTTGQLCDQWLCIWIIHVHHNILVLWSWWKRPLCLDLGVVMKSFESKSSELSLLSHWHCMFSLCSWCFLWSTRSHHVGTLLWTWF